MVSESYLVSVLVLVIIILLAVVLDASLFGDWEVVVVVGILFARGILNASRDDRDGRRSRIFAGSRQLSETRLANAQGFTGRRRTGEGERGDGGEK